MNKESAVLDDESRVMGDRDAWILTSGIIIGQRNSSEIEDSGIAQHLINENNHIIYFNNMTSTLQCKTSDTSNGWIDGIVWIKCSFTIAISDLKLDVKHRGSDQHMITLGLPIEPF